MINARKRRSHIVIIDYGIFHMDCANGTGIHSPSLQQTLIANLQHISFHFISLHCISFKYLIFNSFPLRFGIYDQIVVVVVDISLNHLVLTDTLTMQLASCSLPSLGLMKGAI